MTKCCAYIRVSSKEQCQDNQLPDIERFIKERGWELVKVYSEQESAWRAGHQHELAQLKLDASKRMFNVVVVWALDRLTREGIAKMFALLDYFHHYDIQVISYQERHLTDVPPAMAEMSIAWAAYIAKYESERKSERIRVGIARRAKTENWTPGRQKGARDKVKRSRTGYLLRYAEKQRLNKRSDNISQHSSYNVVDNASQHVVDNASQHIRASVVTKVMHYKGR